LIEELAELGEHLRNALDAGVRQVESAILDARVELGDRLRIADVGLSHLDETSTSREEPEGSVDEIAREAVEDDVEALSLRRAPEVVLEVDRARRSDVVLVESESPQRLPLGRACGGENVRADVASDLCRGHADATRGGVDEDALATLQVSDVDESVQSRDKDCRNRSGLREGPLPRDRDERATIGDRRVGEGMLAESEDTISWLESGDARADLCDDPGGFGAEGCAGIGVPPECDERVAEVQSSRVDLEADLSVVDGSLGLSIERQLVEGSACRREEMPSARGREDQGVRGPSGRKSRDADDTVAYCALRLVELGYDMQERGARRCGCVGVDEADRTVGIFRLRGADEPPDGSVDQVQVGVITVRGDGVVGEEDEP
jgi:hypothetical protein